MVTGNDLIWDHRQDMHSTVLADQGFHASCALCRETAKEIASALAYLHSLNILHGDLSGGNILLTSSNKDPRKFTCKVDTRTC